MNQLVVALISQPEEYTSAQHIRFGKDNNNTHNEKKRHKRKATKYSKKERFCYYC